MRRGHHTACRSTTVKYILIVASALLGLLFVVSAVVVLFKLEPMQPLPEGTPPAHFVAALKPTGFLTFVKVTEVIGGLLVGYLLWVERKAVGVLFSRS